MGWYKVYLEVPRSESFSLCGPGAPDWWMDMVQAPSREAAITKANLVARENWIAPNRYAPGDLGPSNKELGQECPICTGAEAVTDEEYAAWKREMDAQAPIPFL